MISLEHFVFIFNRKRARIICETSTRCEVTAVLFLFEPFLQLTIPSLPSCALMNVNNTVQRVKRDPADQAAWDQG